MASDTVTETSSYSLTDRALWDLTPPGAKLISPHPAAGKPWAERDWNRREALCSKDDASEVASEVDRLAKNILETLGYKFTNDEEVEKALSDPARPKPRPSLSQFNQEARIEWTDLSLDGFRIFLSRFSDGTWALAVEGDNPCSHRIAAGLLAAGFTSLNDGRTSWVRPVAMPAEQAKLLSLVISSDIDEQPHSLAEAGFTQIKQDWAEPWSPPGGGWFTHAEIQKVFFAATRHAMPVSECLAEFSFPAPFKTVLIENIPADGTPAARGAAAVVTPPKMSSNKGKPPKEPRKGARTAKTLEPAIEAYKAITLVKAAATLHVSDLRSEGVQPQRISAFLDSLLLLAEKVGDFPIPAPDTPIGSIPRNDLENYAAALKLFEDVWEGYGKAEGSVSLRWLAAANFEARCLAEGLRPDLAEQPLEPWPELPALMELYERDLEIHRRVREIERDVCRMATKLDEALTERDTPSQDMKWFLATSGEIDLPAIIGSAKAALQEGGEEEWLVGPATANIRLAWDCLAIWLEVHPGVWPSPEPKQPFGKFLSLVSQATAGVAQRVIEDKNKLIDSINKSIEKKNADLERKALEANDGAELVKIKLKPKLQIPSEDMKFSDKKRPAVKALLAFLEQETYIGLPPVSVLDPVSAPDGRFMLYLRTPSLRGHRLVGPSLWRQREKRSKATTRN